MRLRISLWSEKLMGEIFVCLLIAVGHAPFNLSANDFQQIWADSSEWPWRKNLLYVSISYDTKVIQKGSISVLLKWNRHSPLSIKKNSF